MISRSISITSLCIILISLISNVNAGNLDPLKGCVDPETRDELQQAIETFQLANVDKSPGTVTLCKNTRIKFKVGDPRIKVTIQNGKSFKLQCDDLGSCTIDGGNTGKHEKGSREQLGSGGFMEHISSTVQGQYLEFEGIKFTDFGVSNNGGVFHFFCDGVLYVKFYKCRFSNNYAKFNGGAIFFEAFTGRLIVYFKECYFYKNDADGFGGAVAIRNLEAEEESRIRDTTFDGNWAKGNGGGIAFAGPVDAGYRKSFWLHCTVKDNKAFNDGGGIWAHFLTPLDFYDVTFKNNNVAGRFGEAYYLSDCNTQFDEVDLNKQSIHETSLSSGSLRKFKIS